MEEQNRQGAKKRMRGGRLVRKFGKMPLNSEQLADAMEKMTREHRQHMEWIQQGKITTPEDLEMVANHKATLEELRERGIHLLQRKGYRRSPR